MSYCVNCGVELDRDAVACPLCQTPVINPVCPPDAQAIPNFPLERQEVEPVDQRELAILLSAMVVCAGVCCGLLNLFLWKGVPWALFVAGACAVLWVWLVPPLLLRKVPSAVFLLLDLLAVGGLLVWLLGASRGQRGSSAALLRQSRSVAHGGEFPVPGRVDPGFQRCALGPVRQPDG